MRMSRSGSGVRAALGALALAASLSAPARPAVAQTSLYDPRFDDLRRASVAWDRRPGPRRAVVDVVCLVPDLPTFLDAIATWDDRHFFPVLIDDVELSLKFLRAFRPARVVRFPNGSAPLARDAAWERALGAVGLAWSPDGTPGDKVPKGDSVPASLGPLPPGLVASSPDSSSLAGAAALAAGRFQPLVRWEPAKHFADALTLDEARALALDLETLVAGVAPKYDQLGDDCDFVTLAGDYPYKYIQNNGANAFDDLVLRSPRSMRRWGYAGRLPGDAASSAYRAMCALFLQPKSALLYNAYGEQGKPWSEYAMGGAARQLSGVIPTTLRDGDQGTVAGWHRGFDPENRHGLVLANTSGEPWSFNTQSGPGKTPDVPETGPVAVAMIHSFSAESPGDPDTIAGRWLANGAFAFFGSMNEPFLQAFRPPAVVASFLAENLPLVVAARRTERELYGQPWRLVYFGDPLYRVRPFAADAAPPRVANWEVVSNWPAYVEFLDPGPKADDTARLNWALKLAIFRTQTAAPVRQKVDPAATVAGIDRDKLPGRHRAIFDDLLVDAFLQAGRRAELVERLLRVPTAGRSATVRRHLETAQAAELMKAVAANDLARASSLWADVVRVPGTREFAGAFTERTGRLADSPARLNQWRAKLAAAKAKGPDPSHLPLIDAELERVVKALAPARPKS